MRHLWRAALVLLVGVMAMPLSVGAGEDTWQARMWLELDPARFAAQPMVVDMLSLANLSKNIVVPKDMRPGESRRGVLFAQQDDRWERCARLQVHLDSNGPQWKWVRTSESLYKFAAQYDKPLPHAFERAELSTMVELGGAGRLRWCASEAVPQADLVQMIGDLEQIWGDGLDEAVQPYATALSMLGQFHDAVAEIRETQGRLTARLVLLAASESDAKRASNALALASTLGKMVSAGAVRSGQMTAEEASALDAVLGSIQTRVDGARLTVHLGIDVTLLSEVLH